MRHLWWRNTRFPRHFASAAVGASADAGRMSDATKVRGEVQRGRAQAASAGPGAWPSWGKSWSAQVPPARPARRRPEKLLDLYEFEACPFCRRVREAPRCRVFEPHRTISTIKIHALAPVSCEGPPSKAAASCSRRYRAALGRDGHRWHKMRGQESRHVAELAMAKLLLTESRRAGHPSGCGALIRRRCFSEYGGSREKDSRMPARTCG